MGGLTIPQPSFSRSAVMRLTQDGQLPGPNQGVTIDEAIRMFTLHDACASSEELHTLRPELTVVDGRVVYERH
jgi:predicted amidohydrolase YtcJ